MKKFTIGQRVRKVALAPKEDNPVPVGTEGTIAALPGWSRRPRQIYRTAYGVNYDGFECETDPFFLAYDWMLAPLVPPEVDAWAARQVRKVVTPVEHVVSHPDEIMKL